MVVVVGRVGGVEVVEEGEGAEVQAETEERGVVCVEHAVGEAVGLPGGDGAGVKEGDVAVEEGVAIQVDRGFEGWGRCGAFEGGGWGGEGVRGDGLWGEDVCEKVVG